MHNFHKNNFQRIRLPRKTRRCRSALTRRTRSEPPKTERSTLKEGEKTPEIGKITIPNDILPPEYKSNAEDTETTVGSSNRSTKSSARSEGPIESIVTKNSPSNKNSSRRSSARSSKKSSNPGSSRSGGSAATARQHSGTGLRSLRFSKIRFSR